MEDVVGGPPLAGLRVVEFGSIGPGPHCGMMLSDMGAEVIRIDRAGGNGWPNPIMDRGRATLTLDIRSPADADKAARIAERSDVLIEGMRPGVMERLGLGPDVLLERNPRLIFGRVTGWGQDGPLARVAGHDLNYIALTGALAAIGMEGSPPPPPLNLIGDFGGGSLYLTVGILAALWERDRSGKGQVVDAAIVDGVASMMTMFAGLLPAGRISMQRDRNILAGAAPFYRCYECADGKHVAVGPLEPKFFAELLSLLALPDQMAAAQYDEAQWPDITQRLTAAFLTRSRDAWVVHFDGSDACVSPVLDLQECAEHPHNAQRNAYVNRDGVSHAQPSPRFSRTPGRIADSIDAAELLKKWEV
ncbi:CaiB/BaiF CoA-transferase family protein [Rhizorhabdus sp.]|jgi:alpha-methylacyl-CoA racemase|uniref:CaiB/BaiF CoA transferase family protein n=1 Tax=Rhizorhabdus sp. TaxID=1968843 RepID=UPI0019A3CD84|nr:CaiB/BaiF CoA-transferase family protein [Rhizorhabdus sp.]MBD3759303.1 CoA transferase [Rhizorhabdus sp.]